MNKEVIFPIGAEVLLNEDGTRFLGSPPFHVVSHMPNQRINKGVGRPETGGMVISNSNGDQTGIPYSWCRPRLKLA